MEREHRTKDESLKKKEKRWMIVSRKHLKNIFEKEQSETGTTLERNNLKNDNSRKKATPNRRNLKHDNHEKEFVEKGPL